jgi:hypothetical protein
MGGWVDPRAVLDAAVKKKMLEKANLNSSYKYSSVSVFLYFDLDYFTFEDSRL